MSISKEVYGNGCLLLGASLFFAPLCGLAIAAILGVLAEDFHSAQSLLLPITLMIPIPCLLSIFAYIQTLPLPATPFSHPFPATQNVMLGRYDAVLYGIIYITAVFFIPVAVAARIFSTERALTVELRWKKKPVVFSPCMRVVIFKYSRLNFNLVLMLSG